jgi:GAF domain-containing protein
VSDVFADPRWVVIDPQIRSALWVPVEHENQLLGVLGVLSERVNAFTPDDERLLGLFANQAAVAMVNARLFEHEQQRRAELAALYALSRELADTTDFDAILDLVTRRTVETIHTTFARVVLVEGEELVVRAAYPARVLDHDLQVGHHEPITAHPVCQRVLQQDAPVVLHASDSEIDAHERTACLLDFVQTLCVAPLHAGERTLGLVMLGETRREEREPFTNEKIQLVRSIADQAASALHRADLRRQIERRLNQAHALSAIDQAIIGSLNLRLTLNVLLEQLTEQLHVDAADILLLNPDGLILEYAAGRGFRTKQIEIGRASCRERVS